MKTRIKKPNVPGRQFRLSHGWLSSAAIVAIALTLLSTSCSNASEGETSSKGDIPWVKDLDKALKRAVSEKKLVVMDVYADWCAPCKMMEKTTFSDENVIGQLKNYIPLRIDADKDKQLVNQYGVQALPTIFILDEKGTPITLTTGYVGPEDFVSFLKSAEKQLAKLKELTRTIESDSGNYQASLELAGQLLELQRFDEAIPRFRQALKHAPADEHDTLAKAHFGLGFALGSSEKFESATKEFETIIKEFSDHELAAQSRKIIPAMLFYWANREDTNDNKAHARKLYQRVVREFPDTEAATAAKEMLEAGEEEQ